MTKIPSALFQHIGRQEGNTKNEVLVSIFKYLQAAVGKQQYTEGPKTM